MKTSIPPLALMCAGILCLTLSAKAQLSYYGGGASSTISSARFGSSANPAFEWRDNGVLLSTGALGQGGGLLSTDNDAPLKLLWYPGKAAFRVGSSNLSDSTLGYYSTAMGATNSASGPNSIALGSSNVASGVGSLATGLSNVASQIGSVALGMSNTAVGQWSTALGYSNTASGYTSFAAGLTNLANQTGSVAIGTSNTAAGQYSTALGYKTIANAAGSTAIGIYNIGASGSSAYNSSTGAYGDPTDTIFEIGNGRNATAASNNQPVRSNALTVYRSGNMTVQGVIHCAAGGDIPMY